jgi:O-phospho-L-seryl-tRNASec:L-selenocysteinyl-tRNA synthase
VVPQAYGLQLSKCCHVINQACRVGRVDAYIQSTDKNLMVPVGGAIVAGPNKKLIDAIAQNYPGRASMSPILDVFITMLSMGSNTWKQLLKTRKELFKYSKDVLEKVAGKYGERILVTNGNNISIGISLGNVCKGSLDSTNNQIMLDPTYLGSMLFTRGVSGT